MDSYTYFDERNGKMSQENPSFFEKHLFLLSANVLNQVSDKQKKASWQLPEGEC